MTAGPPGGYGFCPPWCVDREFEGTTDHPEIHSGALFGLAVDGLTFTGGTLFVQSVADYAHEAPAESPVRNLGRRRVVFALGDEPPLFWMAPANVRSLAAALVRMADELEAGA